VTSEYRLVGAGLRVRYAGTELARGGIIHAIEEPNHHTLSGLGVADISQYDSYFREPVTRDWTSLVYTPVNSAELIMLSESTITGSAGFDNHSIGFLIASPNGFVSLYEWEAVGLFEINGPQIRNQVYSDSDMRGFEMVQNVMRPENQLILNESGPTGVYKMIQEGAAMLTSMAPMARAVGGLVGSMLL